MSASRYLAGAAATIAMLLAGAAFGHELSADNAWFVGQQAGPAPAPFMYLGAKHMVTGVDHLLYLLGVIFFLYRGRDILLYVTLFTIGHSLTLLLGVAQGWQVSAHLVDAMIGLSVVYKAFENIGGFETLFGASPDPRIAVLVFGLFHGLGLATKLQGTLLSEEGLWTNLASFNLGVEIGQLLALAGILLLLSAWRARPAFSRQSFAVNCVLMCAGFVIAGHQFTGYLFA